MTDAFTADLGRSNSVRLTGVTDEYVGHLSGIWSL